MARVAFAEGDVSQELPPRGASAPSAPTEPAAKPESPVPQKPIPAKKENRAKKPAAKPLPEKVPAGQIVPIVDVRPVMPPADQQGIESARTAVIADDVRRLPPVESSREDRPSFSSNAAAELASYPTTATP
jgi:hypothetical protein